MTSLTDVLDEVAAGRLSFDEALISVREKGRFSVEELAAAMPAITNAATAPTAEARARLVATAAALSSLNGAVATLACATRLLGLANYEKALWWADQTIQLTEAASSLNILARRARLAALRELGVAVEGMEQEIDRLVADARCCAEREAEAIVLLERAEQLAARRRYDEAMTASDEAIAVRRNVSAVETSFLRPLPWFWGTKGDIARAGQRWDVAIASYENARRTSLELGLARWAAYHLANLGFTWQELGDEQRGNDLLEQAAVEADKLGWTGMAEYWRGQPLTDGRLAVIADPGTMLRRAAILLNSQPPQTAAAIGELRELIKATRHRDLLVEANARNLLAQALMKDHQPQQALLTMRRAVMAATEAGAARLEFEYRTNLAFFLTKLDRHLEAETELSAAIPTGERALADQTSSELRQTMAGALARAYERLAFYRCLTYTAKPDSPSTSGIRSIPPNPAARFAVGQRLRGLNLLRLLRHSVAFERATNEEVSAAFLALRAADVAVEKAASDSGASLRDLLEDQQQKAREFARLAQDAGIDDRAGEIGIEELMAQLPRGTLLLDVVSIPEGLAYVALRSDEDPIADCVPWIREERSASLRRFHRGCLRQAEYELPGAVADPEDRYPDVLATLDRYVELLVERVAHGDPERLVVIPHRDLFLFPWWRVARAVGAPTLSILPAPGALAPLRERERVRRGLWVTAGDPTTSLVHTARELAGLGGTARLAPDRESLLIEMREAVRLHLACHGQFDERNPYRSGLVVGTGEEAMLTVADLIGRASLPFAWLVFLGACNSGQARVHPASEFTSLPGAFLIAGAQHVVAALWPAHDGAARLVAEEFYRSLDGPGAPSPSQALADARAAVGAMDRDMVVERLGDDSCVPLRDRPFDRDVYLDAFHHYGPD